MRERAYDGERDIAAVLDLLLAWRAGRRDDPFTTPWRLRLLLTSRLPDPERGARVWEDDAGGPLGFAALLRRRPERPVAELIRLARPGTGRAELDGRMLDWALARAGALGAELGGPVTLAAMVAEGDADEIAWLESGGFAPQEGYSVVMERALGGTPPDPSPPPGFAVRPLAEDEVETYVALYNAVSSPIAAEQRRALMRSPEHVPGLDLLVVGPDGTPAAFCECSASRADWARAGRRVGWLEHVGTRPDLWRRGLGRAATLTGLRALRAYGAERARLVTRDDNRPAQGLYAALDFHIAGRLASYAREVVAVAGQ